MKNYKNTILASLGVCFEYYDFIIYALMGVYLADIFFQGDASSNNFYYFAIFSVGYFFRPLGGMLFGLIADKYGRKKSFETLILIMAAATFIIGLLPTHQDLLSISVFLLIVARILQGIALGGELPNALILVNESNNHSPVLSGIITSSATAGNILALVVLTLLSNFLSENEILKWGWRIPFLLGGFLAIGCYLLRRDVRETGEFLKIKKDVELHNVLSPLKSIISKDLHKIFLAIITTSCVLSFVVLFLYMPTYISTYYAYGIDEISPLMTIALVFSFVLAPVVGMLARRLDKMIIMMIVSVVVMFFAKSIFQSLNVGSLLSLMIFVILYQLMLTFLYVTNLSILSNLFDVKVRVTAVSFCYGIGTVIASLSPALITFLIKSGNDPSILVSFFVVIAGITLVSSVILMRLKQKGVVND